MGKKRVLIGYGVDVDAVSGWLGSYGGEDSSNDISRGKGSPKLDSVAVVSPRHIGNAGKYETIANCWI